MYLISLILIQIILWDYQNLLISVFKGLDNSSFIFLILQEEAIIIHIYICANKGYE